MDDPLPKLIESICDDLVIEQPGRRLALASALQHLAVQHRSMAHLLSNRRPAKEQGQRLKKLIKNLGEAHQLLGDLPIGSKLMLAEALSAASGRKTAPSLFERDLQIVHEALVTMRETSVSSPGPHADVGLNHLVGALSLLFLTFTGRRPKAYFVDDAGVKVPKFASPEARSIADFVHYLEPRTSEVTVLNQILKVRENLKGERLKARFWPVLFSWRVTSLS